MISNAISAVEEPFFGIFGEIMEMLFTLVTAMIIVRGR